MRFIGEKILPYTLIDFLGRKASSLSRKAGQKVFNPEEVKEKIRRGVEKINTEKFDYIVGGHSHVLDEYPSSHGLYLNNGFPIKDQKFIIIEDQRFSFCSI
jgi:hypothetical protein